MKADIVDDLFRKYYNEALLYTMSLCRNRDIAEDVVSTAFYKALSAGDDEVRNFKPWLLTVCRNEFFALCRTDTHFTGEEIPEDIADDREDIADGIIRSEEYRALYHAIGLLNGPQKEAITLFYFSGLSVKDIADVMEKSESNIKVLLCRGRERLRTLMEEEK